MYRVEDALKDPSVTLLDFKGVFNLLVIHFFIIHKIVSSTISFSSLKPIPSIATKLVDVLGDKGVAELAKALPSFASLESLDLQGIRPLIVPYIILSLPPLSQPSTLSSLSYRQLYYE
jgi:hypothetical protein